MISNLHEDDVIAWYCIAEPVENISVTDFEREDDGDLFPEDLRLPDTEAQGQDGRCSESRPLGAA